MEVLNIFSADGVQHSFFGDEVTLWTNKKKIRSVAYEVGLACLRVVVDGYEMRIHMMDRGDRAGVLLGKLREMCIRAGVRHSLHVGNPSPEDHQQLFASQSAISPRRPSGPTLQTPACSEADSGVFTSDDHTPHAPLPVSSIFAQRNTSPQRGPHDYLTEPRNILSQVPTRGGDPHSLKPTFSNWDVSPRRAKRVPHDRNTSPLKNGERDRQDTSGTGRDRMQRRTSPLRERARGSTPSTRDRHRDAVHDGGGHYRDERRTSPTRDRGYGRDERRDTSPTRDRAYRDRERKHSNETYGGNRRDERRNTSPTRSRSDTYDREQEKDRKNRRSISPTRDRNYHERRDASPLQSRAEVYKHHRDERWDTPPARDKGRGRDNDRRDTSPARDRIEAREYYRNERDTPPIRDRDRDRDRDRTYKEQRSTSPSRGKHREIFEHFRDSRNTSPMRDRRDMRDLEHKERRNTSPVRDREAHDWRTTSPTRNHRNHNSHRGSSPTRTRVHLESTPLRSPILRDRIRFGRRLEGHRTPVKERNTSPVRHLESPVRHLESPVREREWHEDRRDLSPVNRRECGIFPEYYPADLAQRQDVKDQGLSELLRETRDFQHAMQIRGVSPVKRRRTPKRERENKFMSPTGQRRDASKISPVRERREVHDRYMSPPGRPKVQLESSTEVDLYRTRVLGGRRSTRWDSSIVPHAPLPPELQKRAKAKAMASAVTKLLPDDEVDATFEEIYRRRLMHAVQYP